MILYIDTLVTDSYSRDGDRTRAPWPADTELPALSGRHSADVCQTEPVDKILMRRTDNMEDRKCFIHLLKSQISSKLFQCLVL